MEASQNPRSRPFPNCLKDDRLTEECKSLISSLPMEQDEGGHKLCIYNGFWYYYNTLQAVLDVKKHFRPCDTDIILVSFPKAGTTWLKALAFALVRREKYRSDPQNHPLLSHNPHSLVPFLEIDLYSENQTPDLTHLASPRLLATHMPFSALHETLNDSHCKVVYVSRNPKDMLVSLWHFKRTFEDKEVDIESLEVIINLFCKGIIFYGPFWDHTLNYWKESLKHPKQVLFLKYEDLKNKPHSEIKRLAEFLECPFTQEEEQMGLVDEILKLCSFQNLSTLEVNKTGRVPFNIESKNFFRKGEVGDWTNYLTPEMVNKIEDTIQKKLEGSGLKFE